MGFFQRLVDFYQNYEKLAIALLSLFGGAILTKLLPALYEFFKNVLFGIGHKIGGKLAYNSIRDRYLTWAVLAYQDLNLTGIIGSGQKPRLEQVFLSLQILEESISKEDKNLLNEEERKTIPIKQKIFSIFTRLFSVCWSKGRDVIKKIFYYIFPLKKISRLSLFQATRFCKIRLILGREGGEFVFAPLFF